MGPEGWFVWVGNSSDSCSNQTSVQSLLQVHLLHRLHCLPLGQFSLDTLNPGVGVNTELLIGSLLLSSLGVNG